MADSAPQEYRFDEVHDLLGAYAECGFNFSDSPEIPGPALESYLRVAAAKNQGRAAIAVRQLDDLLAIGLFSDEIADEVDLMPEIAPTEGRSVEECLRIIRDHISRYLQDPGQLVWKPPQNAWEWRELFPATHHMLGSYFNQDYSYWYSSDSEAIEEYLSESPQEDHEGVIREIPELLATARSDSELKQASDVLGLERLPPDGMTLRQWLESVRSQVERYMHQRGS
jgi:hypothetical protein